ncbi:ec7 protein [Colletotrichum incanum]|uniref:Ec7 protein n=1 Tax=Colletotrichum incanum TaxID=1573173 RepID=A0A167A2M2_COLIC|nr:ec7 protein [Colletotrichum incanum]OHW99313.1 ec7 protein [Colletotrichum incanum]
MVALRFLLVLLPLAAAMPSSNALEAHPLVRRHCEQPKNCGAVVQGTECNFCCAKDVKPDSPHCKSADKACETGEKKEGVTFNCDAD